MWWFALPLIACAPAAFGQASDGVSVAVVAVAKDSPSQVPAVVVGKVARDSYRRSPRYAVLDLEVALEGQTNTTRAQRLQAAEDALERGQAAYDAFELDPALEALAEAIVAYEQSVAGLDDVAPLIEAFMLQGAAFALKGEEENATAAFKRALALDEAATMEGSAFPETAKALFEKARTEVQQMSTGTVTVYSAPAAAEVYIDGRFRGSAPLTVDDLRSGRHVVRILRDGYQPFGETVDVAEKREETVQATLRPTKSLSEYEGFQSRIKNDDERAPAELAAFLKVEQLFVLVVEANGDNVQVTGKLIDGVTGQEVAGANKTFVATSARYRVEVENWVAENFRKEGGGKSGGTTGNNGNESFLPDKPVEPPTPGILIAGWVIAGLTVVPVLVAIVSGVYALYAYDTYALQGRYLAQITGEPPQGVPDQPTAVNDPNAQFLFATLGISSILSDVMWVVAAATLTTGITLIVIGLNQKAEIDDVLAATPIPADSALAAAFDGGVE